MSESFVRFERVHKAIKGQTIIGEVSLHAGRGAVIALCGGNGAGKSTLLRMLVGILQPTRGDITIDGLRWRDNRKRYAGLIGYMPDDYRFSAGLTAMETMTFWAKLKGLEKVRAIEALAEVGLEHTGPKPVASFSKGMQQRVLFAQALLARPPLIVMDEPTNGLDPYWIETFMQLVRNAAADGQTVFFSTHQLHIAEALADQIVFLQGGHIVLDGAGGDIRQHLDGAGLSNAFLELPGIPEAAVRRS
ncbi:putative ABC transporter ATP-binding protein YxlF [Paenibacillus plantiphilus]|uniref:ABC transporter ATP-binding protein YxlF n=1 Tax=Paenibacillus plantiphilus TaxID=2905650 RepID=A0ABM9CDP2_9BACL|nr:ABC transporter ATP-binding protein [Paenibacillus plantiphilus]CAH1209439.1 putative ABC transporter ATP-binding protein YxlF [Paenibacillus plantiphilus]